MISTRPTNGWRTLPVAVAALLMATACTSTRWAWSVTAPPAASTPGFNDVSCPSPTWCLAVGSGAGESANRVTAATFDGRAWTSLPDVPLDPALRLSPVPDPRVDCIAADACVVAVSPTRDGLLEPGFEGVLARWSGGAWTVDTLHPDTVSATGNVRVDDVACMSPSNCLAVGRAWMVDAYASFAVGWDGTAWSRRPAPAAVPGSVGFSAGVNLNCASATACVRVESGKGTGSVQMWDGSSWRTLPTPFTGLRGGTVHDVDCATASACAAVGYYTTTLPCSPGDSNCLRAGPPVITNPVAATWNGAGWITQALPDPGGALAQSSSADVVSCASAGSCLAVQSGVASPVAVRAWASTATSWSPADAPAAPANTWVFTAALSCSGAACLVVGHRQDIEPADTALASRAPTAYRALMSGSTR